MEDGKCSNTKTQIPHCLVHGEFENRESCILCEEKFDTFHGIDISDECRPEGTKRKDKKNCASFTIMGECEQCRYNFYKN